VARLRVYLTFPPERVGEPIVYRLGRECDVVTNIRRADVTATHGWVTLELEGRPEDLDRAVAWLGERGVKVDPIERDVSAP
jgi:hypothetical protein